MYVALYVYMRDLLLAVVCFMSWKKIMRPFADIFRGQQIFNVSQYY